VLLGGELSERVNLGDSVGLGRETRRRKRNERVKSASRAID